jgi:EAL domain-containing protein (putative c-di-GMP-specific phosphodiesterase class I)
LRGVEALVRWIQPDGSMVQPVEFVPLAEETGLVVAMGEKVVEKTCAQIARWKADGIPLVPVSINVSARQFNNGKVVDLFSSCMERYGIGPEHLEIELTESCMIAGDMEVARQLAKIKALGIKLLVDDFGTGYSSLSQLQKLDMDGLKVDMSFTREICNGREGEGFFMAILSMAHVLNMSVVAEGLESAEQLEVLRTLSCNEVQGYFISPPVPADRMTELLRRRFLLPELLIA